MAITRTLKHRLLSEINVVPYIDVMLVLLVIFMITAPLFQQGVEIDLPKAPSKPLAQKASMEPIIVSVDKKGRMYLNRGRASDKPIAAEQLQEQVEALLKKQPKLPVYVRGHKHADYERVVETLVILQNSGAEGIGLITDPIKNK